MNIASRARQITMRPPFVEVGIYDAQDAMVRQAGTFKCADVIVIQQRPHCASRIDDRAG